MGKIYKHIKRSIPAVQIIYDLPEFLSTWNEEWDTDYVTVEEFNERHLFHSIEEHESFKDRRICRKSEIEAIMALAEEEQPDTGIQIIRRCKAILEE